MSIVNVLFVFEHTETLQDGKMMHSNWFLAGYCWLRLQQANPVRLLLLPASISPAEMPWIIPALVRSLRSTKIFGRSATASGGEFPKGDITEQTQAVLAKIDSLLAEAGSDKTRILSTTIYLKTMEDFAAMNVAWESWINPEQTPARVCLKSLVTVPLAPS